MAIKNLGKDWRWMVSLAVIVILLLGIFGPPPEWVRPAVAQKAEGQLKGNFRPVSEVLKQPEEPKVVKQTADPPKEPAKDLPAPQEENLSEIYEYLVQIPNPTPTPPSYTETVRAAAGEYRDTEYLIPEIREINQSDNLNRVLSTLPTVLVGDLIQFEPLRAGNYAPISIPADQRAPFQVHVVGPVPLANNAANIHNPARVSPRDVRTNIAFDPKRKVGSEANAPTMSVDAQIREGIVSYQQSLGNVAAPADIDFWCEEFYSKDHMAFQMRASASYLGASADVGLKTKNEKDRANVFVCLVQKYYTLVCEAPQDLSRFFGPEVRLQNILAQGQIGQQNPPCYIRTVTYGQMITAGVSTTRSSSKLKAALRAAYSAGAFSGNLAIDAEHLEEIRHATFSIRVYGGPSKGVSELLTLDGMTGIQKLQEYVRQGESVSERNPGLPVAYTACYLKNNDVAALTCLSKHSVRTPAPYAFKLNVSAKIEDDHDGAFAGTGEFVVIARAPGFKEDLITRFQSGGGGKPWPNLVDGTFPVDRKTFTLQFRFGEEDDSDDVNFDGSQHWDGLIRIDKEIDLEDCAKPENKGQIELTGSDEDGNTVKLVITHVVP